MKQALSLTLQCSSSAQYHGVKTEKNEFRVTMFCNSKMLANWDTRFCHMCKKALSNWMWSTRFWQNVYHVLFCEKHSKSDFGQNQTYEILTAGRRFVKIGPFLTEIWLSKDLHAWKPLKCLYRKYPIAAGNNPCIRSLNALWPSRHRTMQGST